MSSTDTTPELDDTQGLVRRRKRQRRQPRWRRTLRKLGNRVNWRILLIVIIAIVSVSVVAGVALLTDASSRVQGSLTSLNRVISTLSQKQGTEVTLNDFDRVQASVNDLAANIALAQRQTQFLHLFAGLNKDVAAQFATLDTTAGLTSAANDMLTGLQPTLFFLVGGKDNESVVAQISSGERIVELLQLGRGQFISAGSKLDLAAKRLDQIPVADLSADALLRVENLRSAQTQLQQVNNLLLASPQLLTTALGLSSEQNYLVLSANSDELRPSGGYLSTYGWVSVRNGRVTGYDYGATTDTTPAAPPLNMTSPYTVPSWWIQYDQPVFAAWDGSWSPDFPTTAAMAKWYYDAGNNPHAPVSGVIGIDLIGFQTILNAIGDVEVPEYNRTVTPQDFRATVYDIRETTSGDIEHKRFIAALYKHIFEKWQSITDPQVNSQLLGAVLQGLREKHIMVYFPDEQLDSAVDILGWSGRQDRTSNHDYLLMADANLGNKSNSSVIRQLTYDVEINPDGSLNSRATIAYDFPASIAEKDPAFDPQHNGLRDYANLLQVYTPAGITLTDSRAPSPPQVAQSEGRALLVDRFVLGFNSAESLQFSYSVPPIVETFGPYQRYRLLLQKQPGTRGDPASVQVMLPKGATAVSVSPQPAASYSLDQPILEFRLDLTTDQWIEVIYRAGTL